MNPERSSRIPAWHHAWGGVPWDAAVEEGGQEAGGDEGALGAKHLT